MSILLALITIVVVYGLPTAVLCWLVSRPDSGRSVGTERQAPRS